MEEREGVQAGGKQAHGGDSGLFLLTLPHHGALSGRAQLRGQLGQAASHGGHGEEMDVCHLPAGAHPGSS